MKRTCGNTSPLCWRPAKLVFGAPTIYASHCTFSNYRSLRKIYLNSKYRYKRRVFLYIHALVPGQEHLGIVLAKDLSGVTLAVKSHPEASVETELPVLVSSESGQLET
jgi:hypothetical protein